MGKRSREGRGLGVEEMSVLWMGWYNPSDFRDARSHELQY